MKNKFECLRCKTALIFVMEESLQLGQASYIFGYLPNLKAGSLRVSIYECPFCGRYEFFNPDHYFGLYVDR